jgi:hypothetical protein
MTDEELLRGFAEGTLSPGEFDHRQHVRLAWLHVTRLPLLDAIAVQAQGLRRLTAAFGVPGRYHATITVGYVLLIAERAAAGRHQTWEAFAVAHPDLLRSARGVLGRHWTEATLQSDAARAAFVPPDRREERT